MRRLTTLGIFGLLGVLTVFALKHSSTRQAVYASNGCSLSTLSGSYGFTQTGFFNFSENGGGGYAPTADVGVVRFDGAGNFTATFSDSTNGKIITGLSAPGTYTVNPDCAGTLTIVNVTSSGENAPYTTVIVGGGAELMAISTLNKATQTIIAKKQ